MTKRPTSPGAEELLGLYFPVLDHGFVSLVDYMGTDDCIERAARVSYGYGTRKTSQTRGLIRYLRRHAHTTPSEMVEFKFHCCMPMFIARQWIRHRSACLAGDAQLWFDLPGSEKRGSRQRLSMPISKLHRLWHEGTKHPIVNKKPLQLDRIELERNYTIPELAKLVERREETLRNCVRDGSLRGVRIAQSDPRVPCILVSGRAWYDFATKQHEARVGMRDRLKRMQLRSVDENTGEIIKTNVVDVWESGTKAVFRVTLENGYQLSMSKDHRCLTERGWLTLEQATELRVGTSGMVTWDAESPAFAANGQPAYRDEQWLRTKRAEGLSVTQMAELAGTSYPNIRKYLKRYGLSFSMLEKNRLAGLAQRGRKRTSSRPRQVSERFLAAVTPCHDLIHADKLELHLLDAVATGGSSRAFFQDKERQPRPQEKKPRRTTRMTRTYSRIASIEYVGEEMTYDIEVAGPFHNFVANGFVVHNSVNEYSGRYSLMPMLFYTPSAEQLQTQSKSNNQGRSGQAVPDATYREALQRWETIRSESQSTYEWLTGEAVARELARIDLPLSTYTQWYWKIDLHNLLHFLRLRVDRHAQWEIQEYGRVMAGMLKRVAPLSYEAWVDFDVCGARLSRAELDVLRKLVVQQGDGIAAQDGAALGAKDMDALGLSKREARELFDKLADSAVPDFELDLGQAQAAEAFAERFARAVPKVDKPPVE